MQYLQQNRKRIQPVIYPPKLKRIQPIIYPPKLYDKSVRVPTHGQTLEALESDPA